VKSASAGLLLLALASSASAETRRFAIVLGNNAGAGIRAPLRYAESDAGKMARVLAELGDVAGDDLLLLQGRPAADLEKAVVHVRDAVAMVHHSPDARAVLIFYFSGHSDGESLELGNERVPYTRLKAMLAGTGAELRVAIIDACRSGSAISQKGGSPAPAFVIRLTDQLSASGEVIITSSAADESALESSEVMGSYFTHNFVSGLRGAADSSGDKLVTLAEAYRYAYDRTVTETAVTPAGAQHPVYDYRLSGQGELVLASLQRTSATLVLPEGADRALVSDLARDQVVAEVQPGAARELAVAPGSYGIKALKGGESFGGRFTLADGVRQVVKWSDLSPLKSPEFARKGGEVELSLHSDSQQVEGPWLSVFGGATRGVAQEVSLVGTLRLSFEPSAGTGFVFALVGSTGNGQQTGVTGEQGFQVRAGYRFVYPLEPFSFFGGLELGPAAIWQSTASGTNTGVGAIIVPRVGARLHVYGRVWLALEGELGLALLPVDNQAWPPVVLPSANLGVAVVL
jgi:hypothetical protein